MEHHCPNCNRTRTLELKDPVEVIMECTECGHKVKFEAVLRKCSKCKKSTPHYQHYHEGKFHLQTVFAYTCLECKHYEEIDE